MINHDIATFKRIYVLYSESLERLFLQLINEKLTNHDKFPHWTTTKYWIPPFYSPTRTSEKVSPINMSRLKS